ncbi:MAG: 30S ribosomal protein S8 [Wolbachia sp.]|nr:30S ribosomal protein S8 [Wolbachia sp.]MDD9336519.1 30S ribosomal protein S8 [Wolbachia sp.]
MALSDSIGDFLTRIRNAQLAMHRTTKVLFSKVNSAVLEILKNEGYILDYQKEIVDNTTCFIVRLKYYNKLPVISNIVRVSKPGCRRYSGYKDISKAYNGLGIFIISTSKGVMTDYSAHELKVGGEVLCQVF